MCAAFQFILDNIGVNKQIVDSRREWWRISQVHVAHVIGSQLWICREGTCMVSDALVNITRANDLYSQEYAQFSCLQRS